MLNEKNRLTKEISVIAPKNSLYVLFIPYFLIVKKVYRDIVMGFIILINKEKIIEFRKSS